MRCLLCCLLVERSKTGSHFCFKSVRSSTCHLPPSLPPAKTGSWLHPAHVCWPQSRIWLVEILSQECVWGPLPRPHSLLSHHAQEQQLGTGPRLCLRSPEEGKRKVITTMVHIRKRRKDLDCLQDTWKTLQKTGYGVIFPQQSPSCSWGRL